MKFNNVQIEENSNTEESNAESQEKIYSIVSESVKGLFEGIDATIFA